MKINNIIFALCIVLIVCVVLIVLLISNITLSIEVKDLNESNLPHEKIISVGYIYSNLTFFKTKLISHRDFYVETENGKYAILSYSDFNTLKDKNNNKFKLNNNNSNHNNNKCNLLNSSDKSIVNYVKCCKFPFYSKWIYEFGKKKKTKNNYYLDVVYDIYKNVLKKDYNLFFANCQHRCKVIVNMLKL